MRSLRHFSITKKLAINGHDYVSLAKDTAHRQLGTIQDYYETPEDEYFAKKLEEVASDSAGKQMLEFAIAMYEKNNSG